MTFRLPGRAALTLSLIATLNASPAFAVGELPQTFTLDGKLYADAAGTVALSDTGQLTIQIMDPAQACVLYEETQAFDTTQSDGFVHASIGAPLGAPKRNGTAGRDSNNPMALVYGNVNSTGIPGKTLAGGSCSYVPAAGDQRYLRITVLTDRDHASRTLSPNMALNSTPFAIVAERAESLRGLTPQNFLQLETPGNPNLTQANLENLLANLSSLQSLAAGTSPAYMTSGTGGAATLPQPSTPPTNASATEGQIWYDPASHSIRYSDGSSVQSVGAAGTGLTNLSVGNGLTSTEGTTISHGGQTVSVNAGTAPNQIVQLDGAGRLPAVDGSQLANLNASSLTTGTIGLGVDTTAGIQTTSFVQAAEGRLSSLKIYAGGNYVEQRAPSALAANYALTWPVALPGSGTTQVLTADATGQLNWVDLNAGLVSNQAALGNGQIWIGDGTGKAQARTPTGDVSLSNAGAFKVTALQNVGVSASAPVASGQVLRYDGVANQYAPAFVAMTDLRSKTTGTSSFGTSCSASQTLTYDAVSDTMSCQNISLAAGQLQAGAVTTAALANDAVTSAKISSSGIGVNQLLITDATSGTTVTYAACATNEILKFGATGWTCTSVASLSPVTSVAGKTGAVTLNANDVNGLGTGALLDFGTTAGQLVRLDGSALLPAVDGSALVNVNATRLQTRAIASVAPTPDQVLTWNDAAAQWEPRALPVSPVQSVAGRAGNVVIYADDVTSDVGRYLTYKPNGAACANGQILKWDGALWACGPDNDSGGDITSVTASTGLLGGGLTGAVTLAVDVGTTANQVVQLNGSAQLPAVDGSLVTSVNAVKLQGRAVASVAPADQQVLKYNAASAAWAPGVDQDNGITQLTGDVTATGPGVAAAVIAHNAITSVKINDVGVAVNRLLITDATTGGTVKYADQCAVGEILKWSATGWSCAADAGAGGFVSSIASGNGLTGGPITSTGTLSVDAGTTANKILQLNASAQIPAVDGSLLTSINAVKLQSQAVSSAAPSPGQTLAFNGATAQWEPFTDAGGSVTVVATGNGLTGGPITTAGTLSVDAGTAANKILQLNASAQIPAVDGSLLTQVNAVKLQSRAVASSDPFTGAVLGWNTTTSQWEPTLGTNGAVTSVASGTGLTGGPITSTGTLNVDVGTAANKILQLNASAQIPAVDGSLLTGVNAVKLQSRAISAVAPTAGQTLAFNAASSQWEPFTDAGGSVVGIASGAGLLGGPITTNGTLSVDVGTAANKILQLNASAQIPAVDGSLLTQVNAIKLQTRTVAASAPFTGAVLGWNTATSQWEPTLGTNGAVTSIASGTGLTGGPITSTGTLNVDVGTAANKILQLNGSAQIPAVDGSLLTQINAVKLQTRTVAATAPAVGQVLGWNALTTQWEPTSVTSGTVTNIATGNGLLGGPISTTGTLTVDVGTTPNKIPQLNANAQLALANGSAALPAHSFADTSTGMYSPGPGQLALATNGTARLNVLANGNVGVGVTNPTNPFEVNGNARAYGSFSVQTGYGASGIVLGADVNLTTLSANTRKVGRIFVPPYDNVSNPVLVFSGDNDGTNNNVYYGGYPGSTTVTSATALRFLTSPALNTLGGTERLTVTGVGNVGVGNATPQAALDVAVTGTSSAIIVPRDNTTNRPAGVNGMIRYNTTNSALEGFVNGAWANFAVGSGVGTVQTIASGQGLLGGPITSSGTLSVDVGTAANKILQLNGSAQIAAVDGSLLTSVNAVKLQTRTVAATAPNAGQVLGWNAATTQWEPSSVTNGTVTSFTTGTGLLGGPITSTGTLAVDVGTAANKILQLNGSAQIAAVDGSLLTFVNAVRLQTRTVAATAPNAGQVLGWNAVTTQWEPTSVTSGTVTNIATGNGLLGGPISATGTLTVDVGTSSNKIPQLNANAQLALGNGTAGLPSHSFADATTGMYSPGAGQLALATSGTARLNVLSNGNVGVGNAAPQAALDVAITGTSSAIIVPRDNTTNRPAGVNGMIRYNTTNSALEGFINGSWANFAVGTGVGTVQSIASGTGLLGGPITSSGTLSVDVGTAANKILQLNGSAQIAAVDGSLLTFVNAVKLQTRTVATTAPNAGQVLGWNAVTTQWEPLSVTNGTVTSFTTGTGLLGGPITSTGTLSVDVGTAANKILQLNGSAQIAAVDGSLLTFVNAVKLQARTVAATSPVAGQVLGWNAGTTQWEPTTAATGSVTNVASGTGLLGGPITSTGTLSVNVGTAANQILQLNGSSQIAAVDGSLLTQVNAVKIQTRTVAATTPVAGQYLGWNALSTQWEPTTDAGGSVKGVATGAGLLGGPVTTTGTLSVDVGTAANKILQLNGSAQIAAVDGSLLTFVNAVKLQARPVAATMPNPGQYLGWNGLTSQWEPFTDGGGSVTSIASGTGLLGGPITGNGTLNVDVGTAPNKITQLNGSAQLALGSGTAAAPTYAFGADATTGVYLPAAGQLALSVGGGARLTVLSNGNVGLGNTSPGVALDVARVGTTSAMIVPRDITTNRPGGVNGMVRYNTTTNALEGFVNGAWATFASYTGTGYLPLAGGTMTGALQMAPGTVGAPGVSLSNDATTGVYSAGAGQLALATNGTARLSLLANGNVGVGSTSPTVALDVAGTVKATGFNIGNTSYQASGELDAATTGPYADPHSGVVYDAKFGGANNGIAVRGQSYFAGLVGLGTNAPGAALDVYAVGTTSSALIVPRDTGTNRPTAAVNGMVRYNTTSGMLEGYVGGQWQTFASYASTGFLPLAGGTMTGALRMAPGTVTAPGISLSNDASTGLFSTGTASLQLAAAGTTRMAVTNLGVGFNTTTPQYPLDVKGNVFFGSGYFTTIPSAPLNLVNSAGSTLRTQLNLVNTAGGSGAGSAIDFFTYDISGGTNPGLRIAAVDNNYSASFVVYSKNPGAAANSLVDRFHILEGGMVGINKAAPAYQLDVVGDVNTSTQYRIGGTVICTSSGCTSSSDARLKQNVRPLETPLEKVLKLNGVSWDWIDKQKFGVGDQVGFIAQDLERVFPEVVKTDPENGLKSVAYGNLVAPVIEAIKALYEKLTAHDDRLKALEIENALLKAKVERDERRLDDLSQRLQRLERR